VRSVLIVEADERLLGERAEQLLMDGYEVDAVSTVRAALIKVGEHPDALVLCNAGSPPETIGLLRRLRSGEIARADSRLPVLVVGADDDSAAVRYYRAGADLALSTHSSPLLVAAGLEALARRAPGEQQRPQMLRVGSLTVDCDARVAEVDHRAVKLSRLEFDLLQTLATQPRKTFTRAELTRQVWGVRPPGRRPLTHAGQPCAPAAPQARAGRRRVDGADRPRRRLEAGPMTTQWRSLDTACTQVVQRGPANAAHHRGTGRYEISAPDHSFVAVLCKSEGSRLRAPRGGGRSTS
jgi:DNA-binding response OmpR family regulator